MRRVTQPGDAVETEAGRLADRALEGVSRTAEPRTATAPSQIPAGAPSVSTIPDGSGRPLDALSRSRWESRFGRGFERVRIHTGLQADRSARAFAARAYTYGDHLVFRNGEYAPETAAGSELLAHELAHVVQGGTRIARQASLDDLQAFDAIIAEIRGRETYTNMQPEPRRPEPKRMFDDIVSEARTRENALYYANKLELLFRIPSPGDLSPAEAAQVEQETIEMNRERIAESMEDEAARASRPGYQNEAEEAASRERYRTHNWTTRQGHGATYRVDASDYNNIVVELKLNLVPKPGTKTTRDDIRNMKRFEQGVERAAARVGGYIFDLSFVNLPAPDVFTVPVDVGDWPRSGNIVGGAEVLVHEVHHRLRLPDRYDYIEVHAENEAMSIPERLHLFQRQMARGIADPLAPYSLMDEGGPDRRLTDEDVCLVADPEHAEECIARRNSTKLELIRLRAWTQAVRAWNGLIDVIAGTNPSAAADAQQLAEIVFRQPVAPDVLASHALAMANQIGASLRFNVVLSTSPAALKEQLGLTTHGNLKCQQVPLWANVADVVSGGAVGPVGSGISICSHALLLQDQNCLTQSMLAAAAELDGLMPFVGRGCPYYECTRASGTGIYSADSWAQFVYCFSRTLGSSP